MMYVVIHTGDDGVRITRHHKEELEQLLTDREWGDVVIRTSMDGNSDPSYWTVSGLSTITILKATIITPAEVTTVLEYKLP